MHFRISFFTECQVLLPICTVRAGENRLYFRVLYNAHTDCRRGCYRLWNTARSWTCKLLMVHRECRAIPLGKGMQILAYSWKNSEAINPALRTKGWSLRDCVRVSDGWGGGLHYLSISGYSSGMSGPVESKFVLYLNWGLQEFSTTSEAHHNLTVKNRN